MISVFISYAREDEKFARELFLFLKRDGYDPWMDKENLVAGSDWEREIERAVDNTDVQIFLLSSRSVEKRGVFQKEIRVALKSAELLLENDISIIPLRIEDCEVPASLKNYQWLNYFEEGWESKLLLAMFKAAEQRGVLEATGGKYPIVKGFLDTDDSTKDGRILIRYSLPEIEVPQDRQIGVNIGNIFNGRAGELILHFKRDELRSVNRATSNSPHEISISSDVMLLNRHLVSLLMSVYQFTGGAHGYGFTRSLNVSLAEGAIFSPNDLFHDHAFVADLLNQEAKETEEPLIVSSDDLDRAIIAALRENTSITNEGISISFNDYDVFCYAHGPVKFDLPWNSQCLSDEKLTDFGNRVKQQAEG